MKVHWDLRTCRDSRGNACADGLRGRRPTLSVTDDVNSIERIYLDALSSRSSNPIAKARSSVLI